MKKKPSHMQKKHNIRKKATKPNNKPRHDSARNTKTTKTNKSNKPSTGYLQCSSKLSTNSHSQTAESTITQQPTQPDISTATHQH